MMLMNYLKLSLVGFFIFSVFDNWLPLERVAEICGFLVKENYEEVIVTMPYNDCLKKV